MRKPKKKTILFIVLLLIALAIGGIRGMKALELRKVPAMTFDEALAAAQAKQPDAVISVGIIQEGRTTSKIYGANGKELPAASHTYEIGSLTKTFTAALVQQAIAEDRLSLDDTLSVHLPLPEGAHDPTIRALLTHTAGYKSHYISPRVIVNILSGNNAFNGISQDDVLAQAANADPGDGPHAFSYSNYGYALLGLVLEAVYDQNYTTLVNRFAHNTLGLADTKISEQNSALGDNWAWQPDDAYLAAGGLTSTIDDMLTYAQLQLDNAPLFAACHTPLAAFPTVASGDLRIDAVGMAWMIDEAHDILWHNGGTGHYSSYLGFHPSSQTAVVVLANIPPDDAVTATTLGSKLLSTLCAE